MNTDIVMMISRKMTGSMIMKRISGIFMRMIFCTCMMKSRIPYAIMMIRSMLMMKKRTAGI